MTVLDLFNPYAWVVKFLRYSSKPKYPDIFSINVGNLRMGGTGKTPLVVELAKKLESSVVITLGYGRKYKGTYTSREHPDPYHLGDEGYMILRKTKREVIVSKDRFEAAKIAKEFGAKILIFDDAFQYFKLRAHLNFLILRPSDIRSSVFPFGPLREPFDSFKFADALIFNLKTSNESFEIPKLGKPTFVMRYKIEGIEYGGKVLNIRNLRIFAFCGIADPFSFINALKKEGAEVVGYKIFPDHWWIGERTLDKILKVSEKLNALPVCTEKDFFRLGREDLGYLKISPILDDEFWVFLKSKIPL
jgi:tetraacyldisaccharide 4''-kinase